MPNDLRAYNSNLIKYHAILEHVKSDEKAFQKYDFRINYSQENIKISILWAQSHKTNIMTSECMPLCWQITGSRISQNRCVLQLKDNIDLILI